VKHTLKSNNRALAKALEACRQELGERDRTILSLQEQQQTLQRVAGLRDNQISQEVDLRIQVRNGQTLACCLRMKGLANLPAEEHCHGLHWFVS
jgi:hypothetical protein